MNELWIGLAKFLGINLLVIGNSHLLYSWFLRKEGDKIFRYIIIIFVCYFLQIFLSQIFLGIFGALSFSNIFIFHLLILSFNIFFVDKYNTTFPEALEIKKNSFNSFVFFSLFSPFIFLFVLRNFNALLQIPLEFDTVIYHMPFVAEWFKTGEILPVYYSAFAGPLGHYPSNFELFTLWNVLPFGSDYIVNLINVPVVILIGIILYSVSRNFNIPKHFSLLSCCLFLSMPYIFRQIGTPMVDFFFTASFLASIYFLQEYIKEKSLSNIILLSTSLGFLVGTKYLGLIYSLPLVFFLLFCERVSLRNFFKKLAIIIVGILGGGGFWYIRNFIDAQNPLFPIDVEFLGITLFDGYYQLTDKLIKTSLWENLGEIEKVKEFIFQSFQMLGSLGGLLLLSLVLFFLYFILKFCKNVSIFFNIKKWSRENLILFWKKMMPSLILIFALIYYFYFYLKAPYTYGNIASNWRYAMPFLSIGCLVFGYLNTKNKIINSFFYCFLFLGLIYDFSFIIFDPHPAVHINDRFIWDLEIIKENVKLFLLYLITLILLGGILFTTIFKIRYRKIILPIIACFFVILSFLLISPASSVRENSRSYFQNIWHCGKDSVCSFTQAANYLDKNAYLANIAYTGFNFHYYFYGKNLQRNVYHVNINECLLCRYGQYKYSKKSIRRDPNFNHWWQNMKDLKIDYIVIEEAPFFKNVKMHELAWIKSNPNYFDLVFSHGSVKIYKVKND